MTSLKDLKERLNYIERNRLKHIEEKIDALGDRLIKIETTLGFAKIFTLACVSGGSALIGIVLTLMLM